MANDHDDGARVIPIPPPLVYAGPLLLGAGMRKVLPGIPLPRLLRQTIGALLVGGGILLSGWFFRSLQQANTTIIPNRPVSTLVDTGPFALTRNPGYLGMAAIYGGIALLANALVSLLLLPGVLLVIARGVIEPEEQYLERRFGQTYRDYKARVRRWL
jgi:protein-S-isoprenylcysteine O-methyltransferase Ste14